MQDRSNVLWNYTKDMLIKINEHSEALILRKSGESIRSIAKKLKISTSTASLWCRAIELTTDQKTKLSLKSANIELLRSYANKRHHDKISRNQKVFEEAKSEINKLNSNEIFLSGIALYWAEGFKNLSEGRVGFCNSDPRMITFMMFWFRNILKIPDSDFTLRAEFNITHSQRQKEIEYYWSKITGIPLAQFNKPYFQKSMLLRNYPNKHTYYGVLRIRIRKSTHLLAKFRGWIEGLSVSISAETTSASLASWAVLLPGF